jgi:DNA-binding GntR family transcriptional regulator
VAAITDAIVGRRLLPGTKLAEQKLADVFKVSRTLVRQALHQLSRDRLVTLEPARGAFVATPSVEEARQVLELRQMLEAAMLRRLCTSITDAQLDELRARVQAERAHPSQPDDLPVVLARMLGNQVLAQMLADLLGRSALIATTYRSTRSAETLLAEHEALVEALTRRDVRAATRLAKSHLGHVERQLQLDPRSPDLARILGPA